MILNSTINFILNKVFRTNHKDIFTVNFFFSSRLSNKYIELTTTILLTKFFCLFFSLKKNKFNFISKILCA